MSIFGDYKAYKKYEPLYPSWKNKRDLIDAKRAKYIELHPEIINQNDIQRGKNLLRAIDIMDEYSQKKAENMEAATEPIITMGLSLAEYAGGGIGFLLGMIKPIGKFFERFASKGSKYAKIVSLGIPAGLGVMVGSLAAFPFMAWGAKAEVGASRKGRFEAMRTELNNPNGFAVLTPEQADEVKQKSKNIVLDEDKKKKTKDKLKKNLQSLKDMAVDSQEYKLQRTQFEKELENDTKNIGGKKLTDQEIENAKKDQQILTKLVEKIDIASQDYAENAELAVQACLITIEAFNAFAFFGCEKLLKKFNVKSATTIANIAKVAGFAAFSIMGIISAQISKHASRVGRFKVKQELAKDPNNFVYVSDEQLNTVKNTTVQPKKKQNLFSFLINAIKDNKEYSKYKKTVGKEEKKFFKAVENIELTPEQLKNAKRLQKNTFRTFNKIDENSQKYSESIEALGQAMIYPVGAICSLFSMIFAVPYLLKAMDGTKKAEQKANLIKYAGIVLLSALPTLILTSYITKEQKKASRIADMQAINELNNYRKFV